MFAAGARLTGFAAGLLLLAASGMAEPTPDLPPAKSQTSVRMVHMSHPHGPDSWKVGKASSSACIDVSQIAAAVVVDPVTLDIVMRGGKRWRLLLASECHQLGFYDGLYYRPSVAGTVCAGKDRLMSRAGGSCKIRAIAPIHLEKPAEKSKAEKKRARRKR